MWSIGNVINVIKVKLVKNSVVFVYEEYVELALKIFVDTSPSEYTIIEDFVSKPYCQLNFQWIPNLHHFFEVHRDSTHYSSFYLTVCDFSTLVILDCHHAARLIAVLLFWWIGFYFSCTHFFMIIFLLVSPYLFSTLYPRFYYESRYI